MAPANRLQALLDVSHKLSSTLELSEVLRAFTNQATALTGLLQNNVLEAPRGAPENYAPPNPPSVPYAVFAHDGGLDYIRGMYRDAAAGDAKNLAQSCKANS